MSVTRNVVWNLGGNAKLTSSYDFLIIGRFLVLRRDLGVQSQNRRKKVAKILGRA